MTDLNRANRQCCDLDIRDYLTKEPWMYADFCNTTTAGFEGSTTFANIKGAKAIPFYDQMNGTISMKFQAHPFKIYSLVSDGTISSSAIIADKETITCTTAGSLNLAETPVDGTVFVYAKGDFGGTKIEGSVSGTTFTAKTANEISENSTYEVGYLVSKSNNIKRVSFNNNKVPKAFYITMETLSKDEDENLIPVKIIAYKAVPQRKLDLSFSSTGDPSEITITCDCLIDDNDNILDIVEIAE